MREKKIVKKNLREKKAEILTFNILSKKNTPDIPSLLFFSYHEVLLFLALPYKMAKTENFCENQMKKNTKDEKLRR